MESIPILRRTTFNKSHPTIALHTPAVAGAFHWYSDRGKEKTLPLSPNKAT